MAAQSAVDWAATCATVGPRERPGRDRSPAPLRSLVADVKFQSMGEWGVRRVRAAGTKFVRRLGSSPLEEGPRGYIRTWTSDSMASGGISDERSGVSPWICST